MHAPLSLLQARYSLSSQTQERTSEADQLCRFFKRGKIAPRGVEGVHATAQSSSWYRCRSEALGFAVPPARRLRTSRGVRAPITPCGGLWGCRRAVRRLVPHAPHGRTPHEQACHQHDETSSPDDLSPVRHEPVSSRRQRSTVWHRWLGPFVLR